MQSRNSSKKTRKIAEPAITATPENGTPTREVNSKSRASKSSATNKERTETGRAKHRKTGVTEPLTASRAVDSLVIDPVGVMTPSLEAQEITDTHIAKLAYSYWIARGYAHGSADEDWHRAERELEEKR